MMYISALLIFIFIIPMTFDSWYNRLYVVKLLANNFRLSVFCYGRALILLITSFMSTIMLRIIPEEFLYVINYLLFTKDLPHIVFYFYMLHVNILLFMKIYQKSMCIIFINLYNKNIEAK